MIRSRTPRVQTPTQPHTDPPPGAVAALIAGATRLLKQHPYRTTPTPAMTAQRMVETTSPDAISRHAERHHRHLAAQLHRLTGHNPLATLLTAAAAELQTKGWARGTRTAASGRVCLRGALDATGRPEGDHLRDQAEQLLLTVIRERHPQAESIERYNDRLCGGLDDAAELFTAALHRALEGGVR